LLSLLPILSLLLQLESGEMPPSPATYATTLFHLLTQHPPDGRQLALLLALVPPKSGPGYDDKHVQELLDWLGAHERGNAWIDRTTQSVSRLF
jgi:hypothetical protein